MPQCLVNQLSIFTHESIHNRFYYPVCYLTVFLYYSFYITLFILLFLYYSFFITLCILVCSILLCFIILSLSSILPILFPSNKATHFIRLPNRLHSSFQFSHFVLPMIFLLPYPVRICCLLTQQRTAVQKNGENGQHPQRF